MEKVRALHALANERRSDTIVEPRRVYFDLSEFHNGYYDTEGWVSPISNQACNVDAEWMLILQDWDSADNIPSELPFSSSLLGYDPELPTNKNLDRLLEEVLGLKRSDVFMTNLFPFLKSGSISASIPHADLVYCAKKYALPQVSIVRPRNVICFGLSTFNAMRSAVGASRMGCLKDSLANPIDLEFGEHRCRCWCQSHPGGLGVANRGGWNQVVADWRAMLSAT